MRELARVGPQSVIGRGASVSVRAAVGARVRVFNDVILAPGTTVEDDVLIGPGVITLSDSTMGRGGRTEPASGIVLGRACRIGTRAIVEPGVRIGREAVVGAASLVREDVPERTVAMGVPARARRAVADEELLERWR
jgi:acetyltransferase-like isoleucine patch superfamily enzyme